MKEVDIISTVVGRNNVGKSVGSTAPSMGAYALKSELSALQSVFNDFLEGDDTDTVINRWKELEAFLNGISEDNTLSSILGDYIPIQGYTDILGEKNFTGGLKVNGSPIVYDADNKYWKLEGDLIVTGGVTTYGDDSDFTPSTIMDALVVDNTTLKVVDGVLKFVGSVDGGVASSVAWSAITGKPSWITTATPTITISGTSVALGGSITQSALRTALGLGSNAYTSTAYLPLSGGTMTGAIIMGTNKYIYGGSNTSGQSMLHFDGTRTVIGSNGTPTTNATHIRSVTGHATIGTSATATYTIWDSGNHGRGSGLNADMLDGYHVNGSNAPFGTIPYVRTDGVMEVGAYMDFHYDNTTASDFSTRLQVTGNHSNIVNLPSGTGTLALTTSNVSSATRINAYQHNSGTKTIISGSRTDDTFPRSIYDNGYGLRLTRYSASNGTEDNYIATLSSNVASATKLYTARNIWGQSFDGTADITGDLQIGGSGLCGLDGAVIVSNSATAAVFGYGTTAKGIPTYIDGNVIYLRCGTSRTIGIYINASGNVGIGTQSPSQKLHVNGNILVTGGTTMYSMRALKNVVDERGLSLEELSVIKPTRYKWKDGRDDRLHIGGIADDVMKVLPEVVYKTEGDVLTMDYGNAAFAIAASLINPIVAHERNIKSLQRRIRELEEEIKRLKAA